MLAAVLLAAAATAAAPLDTFDSLDGWTANVSHPGIKVELAADAGEHGPALRIDFDFQRGGGHVLVRKPLAVALPRDWALGYDWRGQSPAMGFEFKLIDRAERNVWWRRQRDVIPPREWTAVRVKRKRFDFAWGPLGGGEPKDVAFVEFAIVGAAGDRGSIWIDDLHLEPRVAAPAAPPAPVALASTSQAGHPPAAGLDDDPATEWRSGVLSPDQWLAVDFGAPREYGGLIVDWDAADYAAAYDVEASDDGAAWTTLYSAAGRAGGSDPIFLPDGESRYLRLALHGSSRGEGYGVRALRVVPPAAASANDFVTHVARDAAPGTFPRSFSGLQSYWTVVGVSGDDEKALLGEDGMLEIAKGGPSLQPFLVADGALVSWHDVELSQSLQDGDLPIPTVRWRYGDLTLAITAVASGMPGASTLLARYRISNTGAVARASSFFLALWPFQVLPPWQSLNMAGGVAPIHAIGFDAGVLAVDGRPAVIALSGPDRVAAVAGGAGGIGVPIAAGTLPRGTQAADASGFASAAMEYDLRLAPGEERSVYVAVPFHRDPWPPMAAPGFDPGLEFDRVLAAATGEWRRRLGCVEFDVPESAADLVRTVRTTLAYTLVNRSGPALQPGPRNYSRAWIRDGAMIGAALLEMGFTAEVRDFVRWFAGYQYDDGKVPCVVDRHGADPLPEHDSEGEFIYAVAEYYRFTRDVGFVHELWPAVVRAVERIAALRSQRLTDEYRAPARRAFYGLLPESVSHEGYAARPVHSYWDDFFALRGLKDAAMLAEVMDGGADVERFRALRDGLQRDLHASIAAVIADRGVDFVPASVELADFDPSSTAVAIAPGGELRRLPPAQTTRTFLAYHDELMRRRRGEVEWESYSPYEARIAGALIRLGRREEALDVLEGMLADSRPRAWNEWPEIVWRDAAAPRFIGDMPHTWVGAGFVQAVRDMFAYEREDDRALVLAAGIPVRWLAGGAPAGVRRLPTHYGVVSYTLRREASGAVRLNLSGDLAIPPGGIVVEAPLDFPLRAATVNGREVAAGPDSVRVDEFPAEVVLAR